jgi:hypothetical protein
VLMITTAIRTPIGADKGRMNSACHPSRALLHHRMRASYITATLLNHPFRLSRRVASKPWFVDDTPEITSSAPSKPQLRIQLPEIPKEAPEHISRAVVLLANSPLIDPATVSVGPPLPADAQPDGDFPLPMLKKVQKSRGKEKERGYGKGVGDGPGQGVYQWEVCFSFVTTGMPLIMKTRS